MKRILKHHKDVITIKDALKKLIEDYKALGYVISCEGIDAKYR